MKTLNENWFDGKDNGAADNIQIKSLDLHLYYDDYGAYPFAWFDNKCYVGDEGSMHSSPTQKYIQDCVRNEIKKYGLDAECEGTFDIDGEEYEFGEYNENSEEQHLVDYVYYTIGEDEKYGKYCKGRVVWKDNDYWDFDEDWDNVYDKLVQMCDDNDDIAWEIWRNIEHNNGFSTSGGMKVDIDEEPNEEDVDLTKYLEADYTPSSQEMDNYIESMYNAGRYWSYEKVICFWGNVSSDELGSLLEELGEVSGIDFSDYRIVYEDEGNDYKVECCTVQEYMNGSQEHRDDDTHNEGFIDHLGRPKDKWEQTKDFRNFRGEVQGKKLGNMPMAKYHNLIYSENRKMKNIDRIITENINKFLINEGSGERAAFMSIKHGGGIDSASNKRWKGVTSITDALRKEQSKLNGLDVKGFRFSQDNSSPTAIKQDSKEFLNKIPSYQEFVKRQRLNAKCENEAYLEAVMPLFKKAWELISSNEDLSNMPICKSTPNSSKRRYIVGSLYLWRQSEDEYILASTGKSIVIRFPESSTQQITDKTVSMCKEIINHYGKNR